MKVRTVFVFEPDDLARPHYIETVMNLLGIRNLPDQPSTKADGTTGGRDAPHPYRRSFNLLRGGQATVEDIEDCSRVVRQLASELRERADEIDEVTGFADAIRATASLAEREWSTFLDLLEQDRLAA
jgi:hypothetical protein